MRNNKGRSVASVILTILIIILIVFLVYEIVYVDIFDIMKKDNTKVANQNVTGTSSTPANSLENNYNSSEVVEENVFLNIEYTDISELYQDNNIQNNNSSRYYYDQLDDYGKIIYDGFANNKENMKSGTYTIDFGTEFSDLLNTENGEKILNEAFQSAWNAYTYDNMDVFYIDVEKLTLTTRSLTALSIHNVEISNGSNSSYLKENFQNQSVLIEKLDLLETIKKEIDRQLEGFSDYDKIREVHNWLIDNIEYDVNLNADEPYSISGALTEGKAVCEGYSRSFKYIMDELEIPCVLVSGTGTNSNGETESHAWNYVQLDGNWYAVDVTWDDPIIVGNGYVAEDTHYRHFLRGQNTFGETHQPDGFLSQNSMEFTFPTLSEEDYE